LTSIDKREVEARAGSRPALAAYRAEQPYQHYVDEQRARRDEADRLREDIRARELTVSAVLDTYRTDYPARAAELRQWRDEQRHAQRFYDAVVFAGQTLRRIAESTHRAWAMALNARANTILAQINPRYEDLRFDTDLSFSLQEAGASRRHDQRGLAARFSAGARDQIYLGVRLAIGGYLSGEDSLPIILDDPFATSDDARFNAGLQFLLSGVVPHHQVLLLTCHRLRVEHFRRAHPDLFEQIHLLDIASARPRRDA